MKSYLFLPIFLLSFSLAFAQDSSENRKEEFEKFKAKRIEYISKEMNLTPEQSKAFWPICNELQQKKFQLNRAVREEGRKMYQKEKAGTKPTQDDYERLIELSADAKIKEAELDKEYFEKFKAVVSAEQIFKYQRAELHFAREFFDKDRAQTPPKSKEKK